MRTNITRCEEQCEKDLLVLKVDMAQPTDWMTFSFMYILKVDDKAEKVFGTVKLLGMTSVVCLDDVAADEYSVEAEKESLSALEAYLREKHPGKRLTGIVTNPQTSVYHKQREYEINIK